MPAEQLPGGSYSWGPRRSRTYPSGAAMFRRGGWVQRRDVERSSTALPNEDRAWTAAWRRMSYTPLIDYATHQTFFSNV